MRGDAMELCRVANRAKEEAAMELRQLQEELAVVQGAPPQPSSFSLLLSSLELSDTKVYEPLQEELAEGAPFHPTP